VKVARRDAGRVRRQDDLAARYSDDIVVALQLGACLAEHLDDLAQDWKEPRDALDIVALALERHRAVLRRSVPLPVDVPPKEPREPCPASQAEQVRRVGVPTPVVPKRVLPPQVTLGVLLRALPRLEQRQLDVSQKDEQLATSPVRQDARFLALPRDWLAGFRVLRLLLARRWQPA
jgi:hypothetical protein